MRNMFLGIILLSLLALSCKSNSDYLKEMTKKMEALTESFGSAQNMLEFDRYVAEYNDMMRHLPDEIKNMSLEELQSIEGGKEYQEAMEMLDQTYVAKQRYLTFEVYNDSESEESVELAQGEQYAAPEDNSAVPENNYSAEYVEKDDSFILTYGSTYRVEQTMPKDQYGTTHHLTFEIIAYKDGSVSGQVIETTTLAHRPYDENKYTYPIEGEWEGTSKHDKRVMKVDFDLARSDQHFTIFIDEALKAYIGDLNATPVQLELAN